MKFTLSAVFLCLTSLLVLVSAENQQQEQGQQEQYGPRDRREPCYENNLVGRVAPWYVYLTATQTSTYSATVTVSLDTTTTVDTVSYRIFSLNPSNVPTTYYSNFNTATS